MSNDFEIDPNILQEIYNRINTFKNENEDELNTYNNNLEKLNGITEPSEYIKQKDELDKNKINTIKNSYSPEENNIFLNKINEINKNIDIYINNAPKENRLRLIEIKSNIRKLIDIYNNNLKGGKKTKKQKKRKSKKRKSKKRKSKKRL